MFSLTVSEMPTFFASSSARISAVLQDGMHDRDIVLCDPFDIEKFDGKNDFGLWQIKMCALMIQHGCDAALETLPSDIKAGKKAGLKMKAYSTLILCLGDHVLREVTKETTVAGIWTKLTSLYMTKSVANRLYPKKKLHTYYMSPCTKLCDHINDFNKLILDLANSDIEIEDED
ncbi:hypothetical protein Tco_1046745 [Tanacetum coccineum]